MKKNKKKGSPALIGRRDALKIAGATGAAVIFTQLVTTGPLSSDAVQGIGRQTHQANASGGQEWHMVIDLSLCIGCG